MPKLSIEYRRGDLHRHHHFDYHAVIMHHAEPYHDCISEVVYENLDLIHNHTKIGCLASVIYRAIVNLHEYHIIDSKIKENVWLVRNSVTGQEHIVMIEVNGSYQCNCPDFIMRRQKNALPCKHVIIVACVKKIEINL